MLLPTVALSCVLLASSARARPPAGPSAASLTAPRIEPALPTGTDIQDRPYPKLHYTRFPGKPFRSDLRWNDVIQGQLGSCFFLATLAELAKTNSELVAKEVRDDGNGAYSVTLFGTDGRPRTVDVDDRFPATASGAQFFGRSLDAGEIRPALFEKAYAKLSGGYSAIDGGDATAAFKALTGLAARDYAPRRLSEDQTWRLLTDARKAGRPIVASTREAAELKRLSGSEDPDGVIDDHVYALLDVYKKDGKRFVRLYTPLSPSGAGYAAGPRILDIRLDAFKKYFDAITIGRVGN